MKVNNAEADAYVLNVVANDYESIDMIRKEACEWAAEDGRMLSPDEASDALLRLMRQGLIDRYSFDSTSNAYVAVSGSDLGPLEGHWYMASAQGLQRIET